MKAEVGQTPGIEWGGRPRCIVTFYSMSEEEKEHARLIAKVRFIELIWIAEIMNKIDCSFTEAHKMFHTQNKKQ